MKRDKITVTVWRERGSFNEPLVGFVLRLTKLIEGIPPDLLPSAEFEVGYDYESAPDIVVHYFRPETDEEFAKRKAAYDIYEQHHVERERAQYERLKRKYGDK